MMQPRIQYALTADGVSIAYYTMGSGVPFVATSTLQWSHLGYTLSFKEQYRSHSPGGLGAGLQIVRYDARGTGLSDRSVIDFSIDAQMRDLEAVLGVLGLTRFVLFGYRHGAILAITYAASFPDRVSHLVLAIPHARGRDIRPVFEGMGLTAMAEMSPERWEAHTQAMALAAFGFSKSPVTEAVARCYRESMTSASYHAFLEWRENVDVTNLLGSVTSPTLVLSRRTTTRPRLEVEVAARIPGAVIVTNDADESVPGRWLPEETEAVLDFLGIPAEPAPEADQAEVSLTPRELEVVSLLVSGLSNRLIAETLVLSERTVARHIANIYQKTGVHGRAEVTAYALRHGLV